MLADSANRFVIAIDPSPTAFELGVIDTSWFTKAVCQRTQHVAIRGVQRRRRVRGRGLGYLEGHRRAIRSFVVVFVRGMAAYLVSTKSSRHAFNPGGGALRTMLPSQVFELDRRFI